MRKPREHGWLSSDGVTHHIDTQRLKAYHPAWRHSTCDVTLVDARRACVKNVDCITCIVRVARRSRLPPRPIPSAATPSWWTTGGGRHARNPNDPWRAVCGASLRAASVSGNPPNCVACGAAPDAGARTRCVQEGRNRGRQLPRVQRR